jgi:hypothetical protein
LHYELVITNVVRDLFFLSAAAGGSPRIYAGEAKPVVETGALALAGHTFRLKKIPGLKPWWIDFIVPPHECGGFHRDEHIRHS